MSKGSNADKVGQTFGFLTILESFRAQVNGRRRSMFKVECDCGTVKTVLAHNVNQGRLKSCGCKALELKLKAATKHGMHKTRIYQTYHDMKDRCLNKNNSHFHRYGGRGITICEEWLSSFMTFNAWAMSNGYTDTLTIERVNNDGNYCPENCTWIPLAEQAKNKTQRGANK